MKNFRYYLLLIGLLINTCTKPDITPVDFVTQLQNKILDNMQFLPDDPADLTEDDKKFYNNPDTWNLSLTISSQDDFSADAKTSLANTMNAVRYMVLTKRFATYLMEIESKYYRVFDTKKHLYYHQSNTFTQDYRVSGVELLLLLRGMNHQVDFVRGDSSDPCTICFRGQQGTRKNVPLDNLTDDEFTQGIDVVQQNKFELGKKVFVPFNISNLSEVSKTPLGGYGLIVHEIMHNYGYSHAQKNTSEKEDIDAELQKIDSRPAFLDVPYFVQLVFDQMAANFNLFSPDRIKIPENDDFNQYKLDHINYYKYVEDNIIPAYYKF